MPQPDAHRPPPDPTGDQVAVAVAAVLATAASAEAARRLIRPLFRPLRLTPDATTAALRLLAKLPAQRRTILDGAATKDTRTKAPLYTARFLIAAARRIHTAIAARDDGVSAAEAARTALARERRYLAAHLAAQHNRLARAALIDRASLVWGTRLGWYAVADRATDLECRRAGGRDFLATQPPTIGWPGTVHPHCRCKPGPPFGTTLLP